MHEISLSTVLLALLFAISVVNGDVAERIDGGNDAEDGKYPFVVRIMKNNTLVCGGSIIDNYHILTAANCISAEYPERYTIVAGTNYMNESGVTYRAEAFYVSSDYNWINFNYGVGLIRVAEEIEFYSAVQSVPLITSNSNFLGETVTVPGWGIKNGEYSVKMQELFMRVTLQSICKYNAKLYSNNPICTITPKNTSICNNDAGSPLVLNGVQIGIAVHRACGIWFLGFPKVHTRVYPYISWIQSIVNPNSTYINNTVAPTCAPNATNHVHLNIWSVLSLAMLALVSYSYSLS